MILFWEVRKVSKSYCIQPRHFTNKWNCFEKLVKYHFFPSQGKKILFYLIQCLRHGAVAVVSMIQKWDCQVGLCHARPRLFSFRLALP